MGFIIMLKFFRKKSKPTETYIYNNQSNSLIFKIVSQQWIARTFQQWNAFLGGSYS